MEILPELQSRRAFRGLSEEALPREQIQRLLEAATLAPSCYNNQPWRLIAVTGGAGTEAGDSAADSGAGTVSGTETLAAVRAALTEGNRWATKAPLIVVVATKPSLDCRQDEGRDYAYFDAGQAALALQLQATREGLIAHPIAGYSAAKVRKALGLPEDFVALCLIIVGKPGSDELLADWQKERERGGRQRKPLREVAFEGSWTRPWELQGR